MLSVWPATTISQPGLALMPSSEFTSSFVEPGFSADLPGIEQRHAIEADRLRPLHNLLNDRTRRRGRRPVIDSGFNEGDQPPP